MQGSIPDQFKNFALRRWLYVSEAGLWPVKHLWLCSPIRGHLDKNNRWVVLRNAIDWKFIDEIYQKNFENHETGNEALPSDLAFGSLYIQRKLSLTDRELVGQISENPYMQYFIGFKEFTTEKPFDPSLLVTFRKRLTEEMINEISEKCFWRRKILRMTTMAGRRRAAVRTCCQTEGTRMGTAPGTGCHESAGFFPGCCPARKVPVFLSP